MAENLELDEIVRLTTFDAGMFGRRVQTRRKKLKITQSNLAEKVGISQQHMSGIERATDSIGFDLFLKLCVELQVNPDYLLGGTLRASNIPQGVAEGLDKCLPQDQVLAAEIIELLRKRNPENK